MGRYMIQDRLQLVWWGRWAAALCYCVGILWHVCVAGLCMDACGVLLTLQCVCLYQLCCCINKQAAATTTRTAAPKKGASHQTARRITFIVCMSACDCVWGAPTGDTVSKEAAGICFAHALVCSSSSCCIPHTHRTDNPDATDAIRYDLAVVKLADSTIGYKTGWLGLAWDKRPFKGRVFTTGYPGAA